MSPIDNVVVPPDGATFVMTCDGGDDAFARLPAGFAWPAVARIARGHGSTANFRRPSRASPFRPDAPMGHYGVNITFSDGHARGIYPWSYSG